MLGAHKGFINIDAQFLHSNLIELLSKQQGVLELLESSILDEAVIRRCMLEHPWMTVAKLNKAEMEAMAWANAITV